MTFKATLTSLSNHTIPSAERKWITGCFLLLMLILVYSILIFPLSVHAQTQQPIQPAWEVGTPPNGSWTVGDIIPLKLSVVYPAGITVTLPRLPEQWGDFEVHQQNSLPPTQGQDGAYTAVLETTVILWEPGTYQTPALTLQYQDSSTEIHEVAVPPIKIRIASVLDENDQELRDLKPQESLSPPPIWPWLLLAMMLLGGLIILGLWLRDRFPRRKKSNVVTPLETNRPLPEVAAYAELERIDALTLPAQGEFKYHYTLVVNCLRTYIEGITLIPALDRTTVELLDLLRKAKLNRKAIAALRELLIEADLVKFARQTPSVEQSHSALATARKFVDETKPERQLLTNGSDLVKKVV